MGPRGLPGHGLPPPLRAPAECRPPPGCGCARCGRFAVRERRARAGRRERRQPLARHARARAGALPRARRERARSRGRESDRPGPALAATRRDRAAARQRSRVAGVGRRRPAPLGRARRRHAAQPGRARGRNAGRRRCASAGSRWRCSSSRARRLSLAGRRFVTPALVQRLPGGEPRARARGLGGALRAQARAPAADDRLRRAVPSPVCRSASRARRAVPLATDGWSTFHPPLFYALGATLAGAGGSGFGERQADAEGARVRGRHARSRRHRRARAAAAAGRSRGARARHPVRRRASGEPLQRRLLLERVAAHAAREPRADRDGRRAARASGRTTWRLVLLGALLGLAALTKFTVLVLLPVLLAFVAGKLWRVDREPPARVACAAARRDPAGGGDRRLVLPAQLAPLRRSADGELGTHARRGPHLVAAAGVPHVCVLHALRRSARASLHGWLQVLLGQHLLHVLGRWLHRGPRLPGGSPRLLELRLHVDRLLGGAAGDRLAARRRAAGCAPRAARSRAGPARGLRDVRDARPGSRRLAYLYLTLRLGFFGQAKATYLLLLLTPLALWFALGFRALEARLLPTRSPAPPCTAGSRPSRACSTSASPASPRRARRIGPSGVHPNWIFWDLNWT